MGSMSKKLRTVELRLGRALGLDVAGLAVLPHLTSCTVDFASASIAAFQLEVDAAGTLSKGLVTLYLSAEHVEPAAGARVVLWGRSRWVSLADLACTPAPCSA